jgi:hypothetical protein
MTEKHDNEAYLGNINLKASGVETQFTKEQIEEYAKCVADPMYFIENFVKIVSLVNQLLLFRICFTMFCSILKRMLQF